MFLPFRPFFACSGTGHRSVRRGAGIVGGLLLVGLLAGCGREEIRTYTIPKEQAPTPVSPHAAAAKPARPRVTWTLPEGWEERAPNQFRLGNFRVPGPDGTAAEVSIVPLAGRAGSNLANVNRWRGQVGQPPVTEAELGGLSTNVTIGDAPGVMFDLPGTDRRTQKPVRMLAAIQRRGGTAWFIKMLGPDALVAGQKQAFIRFLAGLKFASAGAAGPAAAEAAAAPEKSPPAAEAPAPPAWQPPEHWRAETPGSMQTAVWRVSGAKGGAATISVSALQGEGGGLLANVNRWRRQLGLPPMAPDRLDACVTPLAGGPAGAVLVTLKNADAARELLGAVVPAGARTWFYKMVGDAAVVEAEREAFVNLVQTAHHGR
jgi:hypothetical protein